MNLAMVDRIVDALLYEGYILYPYRASSIKNRMRFNFGVVYPRAYAEQQSGSDAWFMQTQCLASGDSASIGICVRFLRLRNPSAEWQEAVECRVDLPARPLQELSAPLIQEFPDGVIEVHADCVDGVSRLTIRIINTAVVANGADRQAALAHSLISAHTVLGIANGEFISLLDPPGGLRGAASQCRNQGTWPVLVGEPGSRDTILSSPIILYDYPSIAPESPGDLFDATEIDEILTLRVLTMTDQEKREARLTDERARRILDRAESLAPGEFSKLHGAFRGAGGSR